ncbi:leucine-rich repeat domain-containing protein [Chryseobacterium sp. JUb7]|uniref:leucine-rich repeat domain-containing protein n=1 Tax=Chryseobacterium sp. JUb7 TaxID=2940599 RepID=UPI0021674703|nr:leucine-rich repeat domain-containing protein [Chryseobacterium sp. JUb7]MCS3530026.1 hypothetical protein [Chryseobacterium sp. JUb7]
MTTRNQLKQYFKANKKPTQQEFWEWLDSYWHQEEDLIPQDSVNLIEKTIPWILDGVLHSTGLSITFPPNVKKIADEAFMNKNNGRYVLEIKLNEGLEEIGIRAFNGQFATRVKTPSTLKKIGEGAFSYFLFEEITLNEGLEYIGNDAFGTFISPIKNLYIPSTVTFVGQDALRLPSLQTVSAPSGLNLSISGIPSSAVITYR